MMQAKQERSLKRSVTRLKARSQQLRTTREFAVQEFGAAPVPIKPEGVKKYGGQSQRVKAKLAEKASQKFEGSS